jgi:hypothetical protein
MFGGVIYGIAFVVKPINEGYQGIVRGGAIEALLSDNFFFTA